MQGIRSGHRGVLAIAIAIGLLAGACSSSSKTSKSSTTSTGKPVRGGTLTYAVGAETAGGFCLPEAQLASGITVAASIYDTLAYMNSKNEPVPFLAQTIAHNSNYSVWTITLRSGVKFHDGTPLTAKVVKNNLDAYRGTYPTRKPLLFSFTFSNIKDVAVTGPMTVKVTTKVPWVAFPSYLASGRVGMMAQAQLDDTKTCDRKLIGTGPFKLKSWRVNDHLTVVRNPSYWQKAPDGRPYPYLDSIVFTPVSDEAQRLNALEAGSEDVITSALGSTLKELRNLKDQGKATVNEVKQPNLVGYVMFNASKPPFDDLSVRRAFAYGSDLKQSNDLANDGLFDLANGPFAPGGMGYVKDTGQPTYNPDMAKKLIAAYEKRTGKSADFTLNTTPDPTILNIAVNAQQQAKKIGVKVRLKQEDQASLINDAIGGGFQATLWTNSHPGGDPDGNYVWWQSKSPVDFGRIKDSVIDRLLDQGRSEPDPAKRDKIYQGISREFGKMTWNLWATYTKETVSTSTKVHDVVPPKLPNGDKAYYLLVTGDAPYAMWKE
jgi:peptide/nickel transport system substrate-binding protein